MAKSLSEYVAICPNRGNLLETLKPNKRTIHINSPTGDLESHIQSILSLVTNCVSQQQQIFEIVYSTNNENVSKLRFPDPSYRQDSSNKKLSMIMNLLKTIQEKLQSKEISTVRDIYYKNTELYQNQRTVVYLLSILRYSMKVESRDAFNIVPAQKGLCYTPVEIFALSNSELKSIPSNKSSLIPYISEDSELFVDPNVLINIHKIIVIEKDAVYNKLINSIDSSPLLRNSIIITGKGYPDYLTRLFLHKLQSLKNVLITSWEVFTDADPYGINISIKYTHNEDVQYSCKNLVHKGVLISQLINNTLDKQFGQIVTLKEQDVSLATRLITRLTSTEHLINQGILVRELQRQLFFNKKGEMNALHSNSIYEN